jgi:2'-5' RNA ligase
VSVRTFLALDVPSEVRERVGELQERLRRAESNLRVVRPPNMHLTVKFIGDWDESRLANLCRAAAVAAARVPPFETAFGSIDVFPHIRRPRVIVVPCTSRPAGSLEDLHSELERELAPLGVRPDGRPFKPHLTVARVKGRVGEGFSDLIDELRGFTGGDGEGRDLTTYLSDLRPGGPVYTRAGSAPLGG